MARIRSVHPSLFTDDDFMELSSDAALLLIGVWTEAFDDGVFAWKPNGIKARIMPAKNVDASALLMELVENGFVRRFEHGGKAYAAIRNFRKFQRPKSPNSSEVLPDDLRTYVGLKPVISEPLPNDFPNASEIEPQMEDGGDKMEGEEEKKPRAKRTPSQAKSKIPENWSLTEADREYALGKGIVERRLDGMAEKFFLNHKSKGNKFVDWHLAWCTWVQNDLEWAGQRSTGPPHTPNRSDEMKAALLAHVPSKEGQIYEQ